MRDAGLQPERTALAWSRTVLGLLGNALIILRAGVVDDRVELVTIGLLLLAAAAATQALAMHRRRTLMADELPVAPPAWALMSLATVTAAASVGGLYAISASLQG